MSPAAIWQKGNRSCPTSCYRRSLLQKCRGLFIYDPGDIDQIAKFAAGLGNVELVDVLPFHQMGRFNWKELKLSYTLEGVEPPSPGLI